MIHAQSRLHWLAILVLPLAIAHAQTPQQIIQQVVDTERAENRTDQSRWVYLDHSVKPKQQVLCWVATTPQGNVDRVLVKDGRELPEPEQKTEIQKFVHDPHAQKKQMAENAHDYQQIDDLLRLLPDGFIWTVLQHHAGRNHAALRAQSRLPSPHARGARLRRRHRRTHRRQSATPHSQRAWHSDPRRHIRRRAPRAPQTGRLFRHRAAAGCALTLAAHPDSHSSGWQRPPLQEHLLPGRR